MEKDATFGELALFFNCARTATVVATTDCVLWKMESIAMKISIMQYHENVERKNVDFLEKLPELQPYKGSNNIKRLAQILAPMVFSDGDEIITEGDAGNIFYILEEGECKVIVGRKVKEEKLQPGQWFGEAALIMDAPRSASVVAVGECKCLALEKHNFVEVLSPFEEFSKSIRESPHVKRVASKMKQVLHTPMDRYEFISILGVGGFGVISLQRDKGKNYLEDMNDPEKTTELGFNLSQTEPSAGQDVSTYKGYNHVRQVSHDTAVGSYSVTDTWLLSPEDLSATHNIEFSFESTPDATASVINVNVTVTISIVFINYKIIVTTNSNGFN